MTQIQRRIDRLILRLKQQYLLSDIRFVREYGNERVETPIRGLLAVISVVSTARDRGYLGGFLSSTVRGETYGAKLEIRVYAPACENGNGLSEIVGDILSGLERADDEKIITSASATSIEFDPNMNAIYRTVQISNEPYEIHQFLTDKPVARLVRKTYELEFDLRCGEACPFEDDIVSISVKDRQKTEIYTLCAVKKLGSSAHRTGDVEYHAVVSAEERSVLFE